jgi:nucleobase:cation symporter-1, NCS1 family
VTTNVSADLDPVPISQRIWGPWNFVAFWLADSVNISTWMIGFLLAYPTNRTVSSSVQRGLAWWECWLCVWGGYSITALFIVASGRIGAVYHISFPVINRSSFGIWGALWPVFNRGLMACIWYGVQCWIGGQCVYLMLRAVAPSIDDIPNAIPESGTETKYYIGFFLFWLLSLPALWFPVYQIRHLFTVKSYTVPVAGILFMLWAILKAGGVGPIVRQPATVHGSVKVWAVIAAIMDCIANFSTLIVNDPDFTRFARKPRDAVWSQLLTIPIGFALTSFIGVVVSSSSKVIYREAIWVWREKARIMVEPAGSVE